MLFWTKDILRWVILDSDAVKYYFKLNSPIEKNIQYESTAQLIFHSGFHAEIYFVYLDTLTISAVVIPKSSAAT